MINDGGGLGVAAKQAQRPNGAYARPKAPGSGGSNKLGPYNAQPPAIVISETRAAVAQRLQIALDQQHMAAFLGQYRPHDFEALLL